MIIFLYGEDEFRSLEKLKEIEKKFLEKNSSGSGLSSFDFLEDKNTSLPEIKKAFGSKGLFFEKQLVVIKNLMAVSPKEFILKMVDLLKYLKNISEDKDLVVVFWEKGKINEKNELYKWLKLKAKSQKFEVLSGAKINQWIISRLSEENGKVKISQKALEKIVAYTGGNLQIINNEIKKLANYKDKGIINEEDVDLLTREKFSSNIFETIEALSGGNKKLALRLFHEQLEKGENPLYVLMMYIYQFRNFLKVSEYYEKGERNNYEVARKTGINPYVVSKVLIQASKLSPDKLREIYKKLQIIDEKIKTGKGDAKVELDKFIVET